MADTWSRPHIGTLTGLFSQLNPLGSPRKSGSHPEESQKLNINLVQETKDGVRQENSDLRKQRAQGKNTG